MEVGAPLHKDRSVRGGQWPCQVRGLSFLRPLGLEQRGWRQGSLDVKQRC